MPFDAARLVVQYVHVFAGILWIGGGFYALFVLLPSLATVSPQARGPVMAAFAPRHLRYVLRVAEVTIAAGVLNAFLTGKLGYLNEVPLWGFAIGVGAALAIFLYVLLQTRIKPLMYRVLALGAKATQGDQAATGELARLQAAIRRLGYVQIATGVLIVFFMVLARFV